VLRMSKTLAVGEAFRFSYSVTVKSDAQSEPVLSHTADYNTDRWVLDVEFADDRVPSRLWTFSHLHHSPRTPPPTRQVPPPPAPRRVHRTFMRRGRDLKRGDHMASRGNGEVIFQR